MIEEKSLGVKAPGEAKVDWAPLCVCVCVGGGGGITKNPPGTTFKFQKKKNKKFF